MKYTLSICPTTPAAAMSGWYILNTYLQKKLNIAMHIEMYNDFDSQRLAFEKGEIDFIYANPYDATLLIRDLGFSALNKPDDSANEVVIICKDDFNALALTDLESAVKIATANDPATNLVAMILLESADIDAGNSINIDCSSFIIAAKQVLKGEADIAFLPKAIYDTLSKIIKDQLRPLISSEISVIHPIFAASEKSQSIHRELSQALCELTLSDAGNNILTSIGIPSFSTMEQEDAEFMIDLMDTLK
jgi:phosphonate transport system substrate-binding protein